MNSTSKQDNLIEDAIKYKNKISTRHLTKEEKEENVIEWCTFY